MLKEWWHCTNNQTSRTRKHFIWHKCLCYDDVITHLLHYTTSCICQCVTGHLKHLSNMQMKPACTHHNIKTSLNGSPKEQGNQEMLGGGGGGGGIKCHFPQIFLTWKRRFFSWDYKQQQGHLILNEPLSLTEKSWDYKTFFVFLKLSGVMLSDIKRSDKTKSWLYSYVVRYKAIWQNQILTL